MNSRRKTGGRAASLANLRPGQGRPAHGNTRAVKHNAYGRLDQGRFAAKRAEVTELLAADAPLRDAEGNLPRHDELSVSLLAETLVRLQGVRAYLDLHGLLTERGEERPAVAIEDRLIARAFGYAEALGLTPRSRAKLGLDVARSVGFDLAAEWAVEEEGSGG